MFTFCNNPATTYNSVNPAIQNPSSDHVLPSLPVMYKQQHHLIQAALHSNPSTNTAKLLVMMS
jgi:hypothetical protein